MEQTTKSVVVPRYYRPWPHQVKAWQRRKSGEYDYYFKLWCRQTGKDTDDIQFCMKEAWDKPGLQTAYVGLDNVWITNNIFKKVIDNRRHWADYPEEYIHPHDTIKEVTFSNNFDGEAESRIKFIGFLNDQQLIGSSYDQFYISEASLYKANAFSYIEPIWTQKKAMGKDLMVCFNGTPRGMRNVYYDLLRTKTKCDDPDDFPGAHGRVYVDKVTWREVMVPDGNGGFRPLFSEDEIEEIKDAHMRQYGNLALFEQEYECKFTTVNAGLVYRGIEALQNENRYTKYNIDPSHPVYCAFDISSKDSATDATAGIVYQYYNGKFFIYDIYEARSKSFVECFAELSTKDYFKYIRVVALPWDSERSASSETPIEEARRMWPSIKWHSLSKERVDRGIQEVRRMLPNMIINSTNCDWLMTCFNNYEYKRLEKQDDWAAKPKHDRHSHLMDAVRYGVMLIKEMDYLQLNDKGEDPAVASSYGGFYDDDEPEDNPLYAVPSHWYKRRKKKDDSYRY